jgi:hypothetical protein
MNSIEKLHYARGEFIYVEWCCLREASSNSESADEAPRVPPRDHTATRILAYHSHNEGHRPSTNHPGFSPLQLGSSLLQSWLEAELSSSSGNCICGDHVTAADTMMHFSAEFIVARELGIKGKEYPNVNKWLDACRETESYQRALKKTGHKI